MLYKEKEVRAIFLAGFVNIGYSFVGAKQLVDLTIIELQGAGAQDNMEIRIDQLIEEPFRVRRNFLNNALSWSSTPQGHGFWMKINDKMMEH